MTEHKEMTKMAHVVALDYRAHAARSDNGIVARVRQALADYRLYRSTVAELSQLTDRDLADLGIHRSMVNEIARQAVYGA
jgi:uncharacterized protein YjiS (DUF1127 family)